MIMCLRNRNQPQTTSVQFQDHMDQTIIEPVSTPLSKIHIFVPILTYIFAIMLDQGSENNS